MKPCGMFSPWIFGTLLSIAVSGHASGDSHAAVSGGAAQDSTFRENPKDLLDLQKLTKRLDLSPAQQDSAGQVIDRMRNALETFAWDYAKLTCEASVWGQAPPASETLKTRKRKALEEMENLLKPFEETLNEDQKSRLRGMIQSLPRLLNSPLSGKTPFPHIDTRPVFDKRGRGVEDRRLVRRTTFTDPPALDPSQTYADLLKAWTTRAFIRETAAKDPFTAAYPDWDVRQNMPVLKDLLIRSPLIAAATLMSPDLVEAEVQHLHQYYNPEGRSIDSVRTAYQTQNRVGETLLIRLKLGTPYAAPFLARKNWTIFIEDDDKEAYEPVAEQAQEVRPIEAIPVEIPGRTYEAIYGAHDPRRAPASVDKREKIFWADDPERMIYGGNEALVKLFFPARRRDGTPVITPETQFLRLIIKPSEGEGDGIVMTWTFGQPKKL
ncbi:MAG: hypothetical protein EXS64_02335 [Candidatus Latescibacteria bacterium]|nr:hypothetical protein [Candidatus Latescibacterota bacterium]